MKDDENLNFISQIKTKYNNNDKCFFGLPYLEQSVCLTNNFDKFPKIRESFKIEDKMKEILKKIGLYSEDECCIKNNHWVKYLIDCDDEQTKEVSDEEEEEEEDDEEEEEEDDEEEEEEDDEEKEEGCKNKKEKNFESDDKIMEKVKFLKEPYKIVLKKLKSTFKVYLNICVKADEDYTFYYKVLKKLDSNYDEYYYVNNMSTIYHKVTTGIILLLNNNYLNYEKKFINIVNTLINLKVQLN